MATGKIQKQLPCNMLKTSPYNVHTMYQSTPSTTFTDLCPTDDILLKQYIAPFFDANSFAKLSQADGMYFGDNGGVAFMYFITKGGTAIKTAYIFETAGRGLWALCKWDPNSLMISKIW